MVPRSVVGVTVLILSAAPGLAQRMVEATSLLGQPLYATASDSSEVQSREAELVAHAGEARYYGSLADALIDLRALNLAKEVLGAATARLGERPELVRDRGRLAIRMRQFDAAVRDLTLAVAADKNSFLAHYSLGVAHFLAGHWDESLPALENALRATRPNQSGGDVLIWQLAAARRVGRTLSAEANNRLQKALATSINTGIGLRVYQGVMSVDDARRSEAYKTDPTFIDLAIAESFLRDNRKVEAVRVFEGMLKHEHWEWFTYIAAEAELARQRAVAGAK